MNENGLNTKLSRVDEAVSTLRRKLKLIENDPVEKVVEKSDIKNHLNIFIQDTEPETKEGIWIKTADKLQIDKIVTDEMPFVKWEAINSSLFPQLNISSTYVYKPAIIGDDIYFTYSTTTSASTKLCRLHIPTWTTTEIKSFPGKYLYKKDTCVVEEDIYFLGNGSSTSYEPNTCWKYNTSTDTWTQLADMPGSPSANLWSAVYIDGFIYMIGVKSTSTSYNDVYKYDIQNNTWSYVTSIVWTGLGRKRCLAHGKTICIFNMRDENGNNNGAGVQDYEYNKILYFDTETLNISSSTLAGYKYGLHQSGAQHIDYGCVVNDIYYGIYKQDVPSSGDSGKDFQVVIYDLKEQQQLAITDFDSTMWTGYGNNAALIPYKNTILKFASVTGSKINVEAFSLISKEYDNNTLVIMQGKNNPSAITTELFHVDGLAEGRILYPVFNVAHYTTEGGLNYKLNLYYGDGESWHNYRQ